MSEISPQYGVCFEDTPKVIMSRVTGAGATAITQATVNAMSHLVKSYASREDAENDVDGTAALAETALEVADCVYNTLQTDNDWPASDSTGYNVKVTIPASAVQTKNRWYAHEVWVDPTTGDDFPGALTILYCKATRRD